MWYVYLIKCKDDSLYCGITNNLVKRIEAHNEGKGAKYTRGRLPVELMWFQQFESREEASRSEYIIKTLSRKEKLMLCNLPSL